ncbi:CDK5 regulatory subunit-associated protein 2-like [Centroberyx affinis]|uniref:CDK5 regulatory subunit-associated protein 2-like n=1 Tax=Centroberyx affinis TaxID=166261 RepID=UPI003A5BFE66
MNFPAVAPHQQHGPLLVFNGPYGSKEISQIISDLKKENFELKLRVFFYHERIQQLCKQCDDTGEENMYRTDLERSRSEVESLTDLLERAHMHILELENDQRRASAETQPPSHGVREDLNLDLLNVQEERDRLIEQLQESVRSQYAMIIQLRNSCTGQGRGYQPTTKSNCQPPALDMQDLQDLVERSNEETVKKDILLADAECKVKDLEFTNQKLSTKLQEKEQLILECGCSVSPSDRQQESVLEQQIEDLNEPLEAMESLVEDMGQNTFPSEKATDMNKRQLIISKIQLLEMRLKKMEDVVLKAADETRIRETRGVLAQTAAKLLQENRLADEGLQSQAEASDMKLEGLEMSDTDTEKPITGGNMRLEQRVEHRLSDVEETTAAKSSSSSSEGSRLDHAILCEVERLVEVLVEWTCEVDLLQSECATLTEEKKGLAASLAHAQTGLGTLERSLSSAGEEINRLKGEISEKEANHWQETLKLYVAMHKSTQTDPAIPPGAECGISSQEPPLSPQLFSEIKQIKEEFTPKSMQETPTNTQPPSVNNMNCVECDEYRSSDRNPSDTTNGAVSSFWPCNNSNPHLAAHDEDLAALQQLTAEGKVLTDRMEQLLQETLSSSLAPPNMDQEFVNHLSATVSANQHDTEEASLHLLGQSRNCHRMDKNGFPSNEDLHKENLKLNKDIETLKMEQSRNKRLLSESLKRLRRVNKRKLQRLQQNQNFIGET